MDYRGEAERVIAALWQTKVHQAHLGCGYQLGGSCQAEGNSLAFVAPLLVGAAVHDGGQAWLDAL